MNKQTSSRVSTIAAGLINLQPEDIAHFINGERGGVPNEGLEGFCSNVRTLAASCMSQDETPGQSDRSGYGKALQENATVSPKGDFLSRLKDERKDLDDRLIALNSYLSHNPGHPNPRHNAMLTEQARLMSELLAVLDERLCDIGISERSAPVLAVDNEDDGKPIENLCRHGQPGTVNCPAVDEDDGA